MGFCSQCLIPSTKKDEETIKLIREEYLIDDIPWFIGYSGGKDSSALLSLVINAIYNLERYSREITVVFCDTGVENPIITDYVYSTFKNLKEECEFLKIPIKFKIAKPELKDRFFVKVIGKGYPTPTNIFRWCTKSLRINPVKKIIDSNEKAIVVLGVRSGESSERDRTINKYKSNKRYYLKQNNSKSKLIFAPILDYEIRDVWSAIKFKDFPQSIRHDIIGKLYKDAGAECPVYRESHGTPCGKGRFGCWTCTVVRKDISVEKMIMTGYEELLPLSIFRNWLAKFRDNNEFRCKYRRNGKMGLGPITLNGRKIILEKLLQVEKDTGMLILDNEELQLIHQHWEADIMNEQYVENVSGN